MAELSNLRLQASTNHERELELDPTFLRRLSTLDFMGKQKESYSKRYASTAQWLLESPDFQAWFTPEGCEHSVLWYHGDPGVGKTVTTSIAINHVTENTDGGRNAIIYMYCDYANTMTSSVKTLLGSIIRQLVVQTTNVGTVAELQKFLKTPARNRDLTIEESSSWIETLSRTFDVVYAFVDALDECSESCRDNLLMHLHQYSLDNMRVFLTSRSNVDITLKIPRATRVKLAASDEDITAFVETKIHESGRLTGFTSRDPELTRLITDTICHQAKGMFLLARLQIEGLCSQTSIRQVRSALESLPTSFFALYDQAIERIRCQATLDAELALNVLSMMVGATRPLRIDELRHALAIEPGDSSLDPESLVDTDIILSVTAGLVVIHQDSDGTHPEQEVFRFGHFTLQEYLEKNQERLFPKLKFEIGAKCISYLSLDLSRMENHLTREEFDSCKKDFSFSEYAANHWADHVRGLQTDLMEQTLAFVQSNDKIDSWLTIVDDDGSYFRDEDWNYDPVFLAAHFHLSELLKELISSRDIDIRNGLGQTPLLIAASAEMDLLCGDFKLLCSSDTDRDAIYHLILDLGADIDAKDESNYTALFMAVECQNSRIVGLLLDRGADHAALPLPARWHHLPTERRSLMQIATEQSSSAILDFLIDRGMPFDIADEEGLTPLLFAVERRQLTTAMALIKWGARLDVADCRGMTLLHSAVSSHLPSLVELAIQKQDVNAPDIKGRTPLHHAYYESTFNMQQLHTIYGIVDCPETINEFATIIQSLVDAGASETAVDEDGKIPKDYSVRSSLKPAVKYDFDKLVEKSGDVLENFDMDSFMEIMDKADIPDYEAEARRASWHEGYPRRADKFSNPSFQNDFDFTPFASSEGGNRHIANPRPLLGDVTNES